MNISIGNHMDKFYEAAAVYTPKFLLAIVTLVLGSYGIAILKKIIEKRLNKINFDPTLLPYLLGVGTALLRLVLYICVVGMLGVQTASLLAVLGAAGLAIGLALQGSLSNFAGGVLLLLFKPFKKGDIIEVNGVTGTVDSIQPFVTVIHTFNNVVNFIPNAAISNSVIKNFTLNADRRVDLVYGISYDAHIGKAKDTIIAVAKSCQWLHAHKEIDVFVSELADSSVNLTVRVFCLPADVKNVTAFMNEEVKKKFDDEGIVIPFPQRDVHLFNQSK